MPCFRPMLMVKSKDGEYDFISYADFEKERADGRHFRGDVMRVPCGYCAGCRLEYAKKWSYRLIAESTLYEQNSFITLTYDEDELVVNDEDRGILVPQHFTDFMKRLRDRFKRLDDRAVRFYMCGEYGSKSMRPHYHAILLNCGFDDMRYWSKTDSGEAIFRSSLLEDLWQFGQSSIGEVTPQSCAYVARYVQKKADIDKSVYEALNIPPEYVRMSRRPGIGIPFLEKHYDQIKEAGKMYLPGGQTAFIPRAWENRFDAEYIAAMKQERFEKQRLNDRYLKAVQGNSLETLITEIDERKWNAVKKPHAKT